MSINNPSAPASRKDIETAVGIMIEQLRSDNPSSAIVRVSGMMTDEQVTGIEQGILLVTRRKLRLAHHYYPEPEEGEVTGGYTVLGVIELIS